MKTAALLPTPGDPFLVKHWLRNCELLWRSEVDDLYVLVGGQEDEEARRYIQREVERLGGHYLERVTGGLTPHGVALNILITDCDADAVLLMEDDVRVRYSGRISAEFDRIRSGEYDVCASRRVSMTPNIEAASRALWPHDRTDDLADGCGMWPAFVFARRDALLATDRDYGERGWGEGMLVPGLGYLVPEGENAVCDTFGGVAFQLRAQFRVRDIPQWKGPWLWAGQLEMFSDRMSWFHCGSLSSSNNLGGFTPPVFQDGRTLTDLQEQGEWGHRLHWWNRCLKAHGRDLPEHAERYQANWERLRERMGVPASLITGWQNLIDRMVTWPE